MSESPTEVRGWDYGGVEDGDGSGDRVRGVSTGTGWGRVVDGESPRVTNHQTA